MTKQEAIAYITKELAKCAAELAPAEYQGNVTAKYDSSGSSSVSMKFETENNIGFTVDAEEIFEPLWVTMKVEGRFIAKVFAKNTETAIEQANTKYQHADFGELADIDSEAIIVEDEKANFIWEK